ncbi:hypothetical protein [Streptomyces sp. NPDC007856]|uniref:zinc finger domain-containing protein n=1 Tax=Streptomyces sp. NPDC007856 TaxID=3364781 RepID=UPI003692EFD3
MAAGPADTRGRVHGRRPPCLRGRHAQTPGDRPRSASSVRCASCPALNGPPAPPRHA